jgi:hypothetical protein
MANKTALLLQVPETYSTGLINGLRNEGYQLIIANDAEPLEVTNSQDIQLQMDTRALQKWIEENDVVIDCLITASSLTLEMPRTNPVAYPPYHLYETILKGMNQHDYGRVVNLYEGPGSALGLSMPQINTIAARYQSLINNANLLFNSVNIESLPGLTQGQALQIQEQRVDTILWLATTDESTPQLQFFRGYEEIQ